MMSGRINILPVGGLCNRLRVMKSARLLSRDSGRPAAIWWAVNCEMNVSFSSLFEYDGNMGFYLREGRLSSFMSRYVFSKINPKWCNWQDKDRFVENSLHGGKISYFSSFADFYGLGGGYDFLRPKSHIAEKVMKWCERLGEMPFGFHIRRTDNVKSIKYSPDELFINKAKSLVASDANVKFFLATDDLGVRDKFRKLFGRHCVTRNVAARQDSKGVEDAVVDMLLLSSCKRGVYGSYWSSFSKVAAEIGNCPFKLMVNMNTESME